ncbi:MAG: thioredoxin domain-containing protein, partial [Nitrospirae bacterium]|nr:thioredoxin domain-containing protein [Nitrospirota bacterium]
MTNRLSTEKAAYLKHSAHQKIDWYPWCDEAFEKSKKENKPVFLSSGAIWCHWCHVMAKESFENTDIADILNEHFICIKLDRDERPDIDRFFQQAVAAMGSGGGWPLSVFLTPDRKPFFGGTYFPPDDRSGRPGFKTILTTISSFYRSNKIEIEQDTEKLINAIRPEPAVQSEINEDMLLRSVKEILSDFDRQNGGFGAAPKFPMTGAMEFLVNRHFFTGSEAIGYAVRRTLEAMAKGGFHDQIGGGFHRYSTDAEWIIPHFEKMANDNAWLLRNYIDAYSFYGDEYLREVAEGIINFIRTVLSDPEGGFYASQDADVTPDDEGGYFTWTDEDLKKALDEEEYQVLAMHLLSERGVMHHDESKRVLFVNMDEGQIAGNTGMELKDVKEIIKRGKLKLLEIRGKRESPFIDRTFYTSLNGMLITSYVRAFRVLRDNSLKDYAIMTLEKMLKANFTGGELVHSEGVGGFLEDYVYLMEALIAIYEITCDLSYLNKADALMD